MSAAKYAAWAKGGAQAGPQTGARSALATFNGLGCSSCHTFTPASSAGQIGPSLDKLKEEATRANRGPLEQFIRESIENPTAYVEPTYQAGVMPSFKGQIPPAKLDQLVHYLAQNAK
jgi:mono/diheme cytochrome c family protein